MSQKEIKGVVREFSWKAFLTVLGLIFCSVSVLQVFSIYRHHTLVIELT